MTDDAEPRGPLSVDIAGDDAEQGATALAAVFVALTLLLTGAPISGLLVTIATAVHGTVWLQTRRPVAAVRRDAPP